MASDFHTHTPHPGKTELVDGGEGRALLWSLPFHPWYTEKIPSVPEDRLRSCAALGELGFDRYRGAAPWPKGQLALLDGLLQLASEWNKPVVLHAVGPLELLFKAVAPYGKIKFLLHGFSRPRPDLLEEVLKRDFYVSLNPVLLKDEKIPAFLKSRPGARVGLETDDDDSLDIASLYEQIGIPGFEARADELFKEFLSL